MSLSICYVQHVTSHIGKVPGVIETMTHGQVKLINQHIPPPGHGVIHTVKIQTDNPVQLPYAIIDIFSR